MSNLKLSLTQKGINDLMRKGINIFKQYSVTDQYRNYAIDAQPNLTEVFAGGKTTLVTYAQCHMAEGTEITETPPSTQQRLASSERLRLEAAKLDCGNEFTATNPNLTINLGTWFNYLLNSIDNYVYSNRLTVPIINSLTAVVERLDVSTYQYNEVSRSNDLDVRYSFTDGLSCDKFLSFNAYTMKIENNLRQINDTTTNPIDSTMLLMANTDQGQPGSADNLVLSLAAPTYGYATIATTSNDNTYHKGGFVSITQLEAMDKNDINNAYKSVIPAACINSGGNDVSMYLLTDVTKAIESSVDGLSTLNRYKNVNGQTLLEACVIKAKTYIQAAFVNTSSGVWEQTINMKVNNRRFGGVIYNANQIIGGEYTLTFKHDVNNVDDTFDNIITQN